MRVCMFSMLLPLHATGGMELHTLGLAEGIVEAGHEVVIITSRHPRGVEHEKVDGIDIYYVDSAPTSRYPLNRNGMRKLEQLNSKERFDVIHSQSGAAFRYVKDGLKDKLRIPLVTTMHGTSHGEIRSILNQGFDLMSIPKVLFQLYMLHFVAKVYLRGSDAVIAISDKLAKDIGGEFGIGAKVRTVYNGVDTGKFKPKEAHREGKRTVLSVCVLHRQKGIQHLIAAFKRISVPDVRLIVVGDGPYRGALERLAGKDGVEFKGRVPYGELPGYYNGCGVFVLPSFGVEGLPMVVLEAMSCGRPVVASRIGGIPDIIEDGVDGLLFKPGDVDELAGKITNVLGDKDLAGRLGTKARETVVKRFSREKMVEDTIRVYESVVR